MGLLNLQGRSLYTLMKLVCGTSFMMYGVRRRRRETTT